MSKSKNKDKGPFQPPLPPRWKGTESLELVYQLNERALTLLAEAARSHTAVWPVNAEHQALWSALSPQGLQRAAQFPFVTLDAFFTEEPWWRAVAQSAPIPERSGTSAWPTPVAAELLSELLVFAWHTVKLDRRVARLALGIVPAVADVIATLTPQQLAGIAARHAGALRLRWQEDPEFWLRLATAARDTDEEGLSDIHLHAKLLLSGSLIAPGTPGPRK